MLRVDIIVIRNPTICLSVAVTAFDCQCEGLEIKAAIGKGVLSNKLFCFTKQ